MRAKDFVPASKPRNFVAKNQKTAGAGAHKDKKRAAKQGDVKHKKQDVDEGWDDIKKFGKKAAVAGAIGLGALGSAQAQDAPSGEDLLPSIVAHVTFKVDGKIISKDINLGTTFKSPGQAGDALAKFLKSKGIKYYDYSLERVKANEPLITPDEMRASNQEYDRRQNTGNLDTTPLTAKSDSKSGRMEPDKGYTSPSRGAQAKDYMSKEGVAESLIAELTGYGSNNRYKPLGTFKRYQMYVSKEKFNKLYFIAVAENPRTLDAKFKAKGNTPQEAIDALKVEVEKEIDVATKVSGQATLDFNVDFVREILEMSTDTFYAKIVSGPKLVIAGSEMTEYPDIMRDEGFKSSTIRTYKGGEGTTKLPGVPLNSKAAMSANLIANGRYVLGTEHMDKDGNRVFDLEFDSVVQASNDKMRLRAPAVTVGTNRPKDTTEGRL